MAGEAQLTILPTQSRNLGSPSSVTDKHRVSHLCFSSHWAPSQLTLRTAHFVFWGKAGKDNVSGPQRLPEPKMTQKV